MKMETVPNSEAIKRLANAVILRACDDFGTYPHGRDVEAFFLSDWFILLSRGSVEGRTIIKYLEEEQKIYGKKVYSTEKFYQY